MNQIEIILNTNDLSQLDKQKKLEYFILDHIKLGINNKNIQFNGFNLHDIIPHLNKKITHAYDYILKYIPKHLNSLKKDSREYEVLTSFGKEIDILAKVTSGVYLRLITKKDHLEHPTTLTSFCLDIGKTIIHEYIYFNYKKQNTVKNYGQWKNQFSFDYQFILKLGSVFFDYLNTLDLVKVILVTHRIDKKFQKINYVEVHLEIANLIPKFKMLDLSLKLPMVEQPLDYSTNCKGRIFLNKSWIDIHGRKNSV